MRTNCENAGRHLARGIGVDGGVGRGSWDRVRVREDEFASCRLGPGLTDATTRNHSIAYLRTAAACARVRRAIGTRYGEQLT
jgi:hypothetical protein